VGDVNAAADGRSLRRHRGGLEWLGLGSQPEKTELIPGERSTALSLRMTVEAIRMALPEASRSRVGFWTPATRRLRTLN
jgi:hypothetical protein